jgi:hypothetical protein
MDDQSGVSARGGRRLVAFVVLSIAAASGLGWGVIGIVNALESEACGPYGYGGYCAPFEIDVNPTTDLVDGQAVTVRGRRFTPNTTFGAAVCVAAVPGIDGCDLSNTALTTTDTKGRATVTLRVRRVIFVQGRKIDCALKPCILGAGTVNGTTPIEVTSMPISFDPDVPPLPKLEVQVRLSSATTRGMTGTITCSREATADVSGYVRVGRWLHDGPDRLRNDDTLLEPQLPEPWRPHRPRPGLLRGLRIRDRRSRLRQRLDRGERDAHGPAAGHVLTLTPSLLGSVDGWLTA